MMDPTVMVFLGLFLEPGSFSEGGHCTSCIMNKGLAFSTLGVENKVTRSRYPVCLYLLIGLVLGPIQ